MPMRIAGGRVVTAGGVLQADVVVEDGRIVALEAPASRGDIGARGCVVLTGGVDPHAHPLADIGAATLAAARGGITTMLAFTAPRPDESPADAFTRARDEIVPLGVVDVHLHATISEPDLLGQGRARAASARRGA
jgi:dihydropyrimidinase